MLKFRPIGDRLVVKRGEATYQTASGLFIPQTAVPPPSHGTVVAVGTGVDDKAGRRPLGVKVGDTVLWFGYRHKKTGGYVEDGVEIEQGGQRYLVLSEEDLLAVVAPGVQVG